MSTKRVKAIDDYDDGGYDDEYDEGYEEEEGGGMHPLQTTYTITLANAYSGLSPEDEGPPQSTP